MYDMKTVLLLLAGLLSACVDTAAPPAAAPPASDESEVAQIGYVDCDGGVPDSGTWVTGDRR